MRILWSDDPEAPSAYREAIAKVGHPRCILVCERGDATDQQVADALQAFIDRDIIVPAMESNEIVAWNDRPRRRSPLRVAVCD